MWGPLTACLGLALTVPGVEAPQVTVGVARVDITPDYPVRLHGYNARKAPSVGVQQRLHAKALALGTDDEGPSVLITVDGLGVPAAITREVAGRLARRSKVVPERLAIAASHTHSAPCLSGLATNIFGTKLPENEQAVIDRYTSELTDRLESVALTALADRLPASLAWGQGRGGFAVNRRVIRPDGTVAFGENAAGPVEHSVPTLVARGPDGTPRAIVVGYACHCTTLDPQDNLINGDWAGYAQEAVEREFPGSVALTVIGCGADANPLGRTSLDKAKAHGAALAAEVVRVVREGPTSEIHSAPKGYSRQVDLPFDTLPTREQLQKLVEAGGPPGFNASTQLARLERDGHLPSGITYAVQTWQFGEDLLLVFLAGEVVVDYATHLKGELDAKRLWVVAYANDAPCYIPSERILREGGYEAAGAMVYYGHPTRLAPGVEDRIVSAVLELAPAPFRLAGR
jgi:hypothetical protein